MRNRKAETYPGRPCKRNHVDPDGHTWRYTSNNACVQCGQIEQALKRRRRGAKQLAVCQCKYCKTCLKREYTRNWRATRRKLGKSA